MPTVQVKKICKIFCLHWVPFCNNIHSLPQIWPDCGSANHAAKFDKLSCKSMVLRNKCNYPSSSAIFLTIWFHLTWCALKRKDARWLWKGCSPACLKSPVAEIHLAYVRSRSWPTSCPVISSSLKRHSWGLQWICDAVPNQKHCTILKHLKFLIECFTALWNDTCWKHGFRKRKEKISTSVILALVLLKNLHFHRENLQCRVYLGMHGLWVIFLQIFNAGRKQKMENSIHEGKK